MKRFKSILALILALVMVFALCACGGGNGDTPSDTPADGDPATDAPAADNGNDDEPSGDAPAASSVNLSPSTYDYYAETVDPIEATLTIDVGYTQSFGGSYNPQGDEGTRAPDFLDGLVYDFLFYFDGDNDNTMYSYILEDWYQEDDTTFVMKIRDGAYFQTKDGYYADVTGEDILFSLESYVTQFSMFSAHFAVYNYETSYVSDDGLTVYLKSDEPYGPFLRPAPVICKQWVEENGWDSELWTTDPCSSGPYTAGSFVSGSSVSVVLRDTEWWNYDYRQTPVKEYVVHLYNEVSTMYIDLETGAIDLALSLDAQDYERAVNNPPENVAVELTTSGNLWFLGIGGSQGQNEYLADIKVREAIAHAVDWVAVAQTSFGSMYGPGWSAISPNSSYYTEGLVDVYEYNPELAKQILEEAGYSDGEIVFNNVNFGKQATVAEAIQGYLAAVGITMNVETYEFVTTLQSWLGTGDPACDTAFNDQTDASGEPCDNIGFYSTYTESSFPVLVATDEYWNELYNQLKHTKDAETRQELCDEIAVYVHDNYLFYPCGICYDSVGYRTDVISDANLFGVFVGLDLSLIDCIY